MCCYLTLPLYPLALQSASTQLETAFVFSQANGTRLSCVRVRGRTNIFCADQGFWSDWTQECFYGERRGSWQQSLAVPRPADPAQSWFCGAEAHCKYGLHHPHPSPAPLGRGNCPVMATEPGLEQGVAALLSWELRQRRTKERELPWVRLHASFLLVSLWHETVRMKAGWKPALEL